MARPAPAATRAAQLLSLLAAHPEESFSLSELSRRLRVGLGSTHALVHALAEVGYVQRDPYSGTWSIGPLLVAVGDAAASRHPLIERARTALHDVAVRHGLGGLLTTLQDGRLLILHQVGGRVSGQVGDRTTVGQRLPALPPVAAIHVAHAGPEVQEAWLGSAPVEHRTAFARLLSEVRDAGWIARFGQRHQPLLRRSLQAVQDEPYADRAAAALQDVVGELADPEAVSTSLEARRGYDVVNLAVLAESPVPAASVGLYLVDFPPVTRGAELARIVEELCSVRDSLTSGEEPGRLSVTGARSVGHEH